MSGFDALSIRVMQPADVAFGLRLSTQAGWNQVAKDWQRVLSLAGDDCFVAETAGDPVGTTAVIRFGDVAWIALVLVEQSLRGRGIGGTLMQHAIAYCDASGVATVRLDATPLGRPIYEKLGFVPAYEVVRYVGELKRGSAIAAQVVSVREEDLAAICRMDRTVTGCDRSKLLLRLFAEGAFLCFRDGGRVTGFVHSRPGREAVQLGPCVASEPYVGEALLDAVAPIGVAKRFFIDVPRNNDLAIAWVQRQGCVEQRTLLRMERGRPVADHPDLLWAGTGPEKG